MEHTFFAHPTAAISPRATIGEGINSWQLSGLVLIAILILAIGLRMWGIGFGLPQRYHIDEPPYVLAALRIATGDLTITYPYNSPNIFEFLLTGLYGVWYVIGHIAGTFASPRALSDLYKSDPSGFFLLARGLSVVISTGTVALLYFLGKLLSGRVAGLLAALFLTISFAHARDAHYAVTDTLITALVVSCLLATVTYSKKPRVSLLILAGISGGAAVGLKYLPAPVLAAPLLAVVLKGHESPSPRIRNWVVEISALCTGSIVGFLVAFPAVLISPAHFQQQWAQVWQQAAGPLGDLVVDESPAAIYYLKTFIWSLGLPLCAAAVAGALYWLKRREPRSYGYVLIVLIGYFASICFVKTSFARYAIPLVPEIVLLATYATVTATQWLQQRTSYRVGIAAGAILGLVVLMPAAVDLFRHDWLLTTIDTRTLARQWIEQNVPKGASLLNQWYGPVLSTPDDFEPGTQYTYKVVTLDPFNTQPQMYDLNTYRGYGVSYIILNDWSVNFRHHDEAQNQLESRFFGQVQAEGVAVAQFRPGTDGTSLPFVFEQIYGPYTSLWQLARTGPTITIYRLTPSSQTRD